MYYQVFKMNNMWKVAAGAYKSGLGNLGKSFALKRRNPLQMASSYSRTMWYMCSSNSNGEKFLKVKAATQFCQCGCSGLLHTAGEKSLMDYLKAEIVEEQKIQKMDSLPKTVAGFSVTADGGELEFKKETDRETICINMNVIHSVDTDAEESETGELKAKPNFEIDIMRNNTTLSFSCSYLSYADDGEKGDLYQIDEITSYEGEWNEKNYSVAGDILDENLYDLFMTFLHEKGITNELMEDISEVATFYEHSKYVELLQRIQKFASSK